MASPLKVRIGDLFVAPTEGEQTWAALGAGALLLGVLMPSRGLAAAGALAIAGVALAVYEEAQTFTDPDLMNAFFRSDGALSATRPDDVAELRRRAWSVPR